MKRKETYKKNKSRINRKYKISPYISIIININLSIHTAKRKTRIYAFLPFLCCKPHLSQYLVNLVSSSTALVTGCLLIRAVCLYVSHFVFFLVVNKSTSLPHYFSFLVWQEKEQNELCLLVLVDCLDVEYLQPLSL